MNQQAVSFLGSSLDYVFGHLESALGGHGNGVAGLWVDRGTARIRKGVNLSASQAAMYVRRYAEQGADWMLFHTRRATSSAIEDQHCHPFKSGQLVLAHNGHDAHFATIGKALKISDSECIARTWSRMRFPLPDLEMRTGVFIGFQNGHPFVVKGREYGDLIAAWNQGSRAILFASELPQWLVEGIFDQVVSIRTIQWFGRDLDPKTLDVHPYHLHAAQRDSFYRHWGQHGWADDLDELEELYDEEMEDEEDWRLQKQVEEDGYRL